MSLRFVLIRLVFTTLSCFFQDVLCYNYVLCDTSKTRININIIETVHSYCIIYKVYIQKSPRKIFIKNLFFNFSNKILDTLFNVISYIYKFFNKK